MANSTVEDNAIPKRQLSSLNVSTQPLPPISRTLPNTNSGDQTMKLTSIAIFSPWPSPPLSLAGDSVKTVVPKPKIVDFEGKKTPMEFYWIGVTDSLMQGKSKVAATIAPDGAAGTKQSLKIEGSVIVGTNPYIMFAGAATRFEGEKALYDATSFTGIKFWAKGDGNTLQNRSPRRLRH